MILLDQEQAKTQKQRNKLMRIFCMTNKIDEIFPAYIAPAFQAISVFCLTLPKHQLITNIFGGAQPFEGLGFLNISGDWALVGAHGPLYTPLNAQVHKSGLSSFVLLYLMI
jgi:hypothetical protein